MVTLLLPAQVFSSSCTRQASQSDVTSFLLLLKTGHGSQEARAADGLRWTLAQHLAFALNSGFLAPMVGSPGFSKMRDIVPSPEAVVMGVPGIAIGSQKMGSEQSGRSVGQGPGGAAPPQTLAWARRGQWESGSPGAVRATGFLDYSPPTL